MLIKRTATCIGVALLAALSATAGIAATAAPVEEPPELGMIVAVAGDVLAVDDLCQWKLAPRVEAVLLAAAKHFKLPEPQQRRIRTQIADIRKSKFGNLSPSALARTRDEICTLEQRKFLEKLIAGVSFD